MAKKINCWEFKKCGRGLNGKKVKELGMCPAASETAAQGLNGGINGGRMCWAIAGTYSLKDTKSSCSRMSFNCYECDFHRKVLLEEKIIKPGILK